MNGGKGIAYAVLLPILFLLTSSPSTEGLDIIFHATHDCSDAGIQCTDAPAYHCCKVDSTKAWVALQIVGGSSCTSTRTFYGGTCTTFNTLAVGNGCFDVLTITGADYFDSCRSRRSLLARELVEPVTPSDCKGQIHPDAVTFTELGGKGKWVLKSPNATQLYLQLNDLPEEEKKCWLQSQGAVHQEL